MALSLDTLVRKRSDKPPRIVIYGRGKTGKTTLATEFPNPIFLQTEGGAGDLELTTFTEQPFTSFGQFEEAVDLLWGGGHDFKTVVVDSLTQLEPLIWDEACRQNGWRTIAQPGFGKGYEAVDDVWRLALRGLNSLCDKGMTIVAIAHEQVERFSNPRGADYDRYKMRLHVRKGGGAEPLVREWADVIGFLDMVVMIDEQEAGFGKKIVKTTGSGQRELHLAPRAAFEAGSRYACMPDQVLINRGQGYAALAPFLPCHRDAKADAA